MNTTAKNKARKMVRSIRARFTKGRLEPLENTDLQEGDEVTLTITEEGASASAKEAFRRAAGAWADTLDFDSYLEDLYANRRHSGRGVTL